MNENTYLQFNSGEVVRTLKYFADQVLEVRILNAVTADRKYPHTVSGYFDHQHLDQVPAELAVITSASGVYFTLNPVDPALLARSNNRLRSAEKGGTTSDGEIVERHYLMVDCDPVRPAGISSTDAEHQAALDRAQKIKEALSAEGWPAPVSADSGNGAHVIYAVDLPTDDGGLVERCLKALDHQFSDAAVKIDTTVHNLSRIWKLYGTMSCKGDSTPERPHRGSRMLDAPDGMGSVPREKLEALAAQCPVVPANASTRNRGGNATRFDLDAWAKKHDLVNRFGGGDPEPWRSADGKQGTRRVLRICPWDPNHTNGSAYIVQFEDGAIAAGCQHDSCSEKNWHALRDLLEPGWNEQAEGRQRAADVAVELAIAAGIELFHGPGADGAAYATVPINGHHETYPIKTDRFKRWIGYLYFAQEGRGLPSQAQQDVVDTLTAQALYVGEEHDVHIRIAKHEGQIYFDYGAEDWTVIEIDHEGWREVQSPVKFIRPRGFLAMPKPERGGSVNEWRELLNIQDDAEWALLITSVAGMFWPKYPYVVLIVSGEQGSAKTTTCCQVRLLVDPNKSLLRAEPGEVRDLAISASNNWVMAYDNLSYVQPWLSDALCRLSTGSGFATRELYANDAETIFDAQRPMLVNGIGEPVTRADLLDRAVSITLPSIPEDKRRTEAQVMAEFEQHRPRIVGALLDAVSAGIRNLPGVKLDLTPRMADFTVHGVAMEPALGLAPGTFLTAYRANREGAHDTALDGAPIVPALLEMMSIRRDWNGYSQQLLKLLEGECYSTERQHRQHGWPQNASRLTATLKRLAPNLRGKGLNVTFGKHDHGGIPITIAWMSGRAPAAPSAPFPLSPPAQPAPSMDEIREMLEAQRPGIGPVDTTPAAATASKVSQPPPITAN